MADSCRELAQLMIAGDGEGARRLTGRLLAEERPAREILDEGLMNGMDVVGARMKSGDCFIPEVLMSARGIQGCLDLVKPHLQGGATSAGTIVIGTVEGNVHDIGKNLVATTLAGGGFTVVNVGTGVSAAALVAAVKDHGAAVLAMSALLTTTVPRPRETIALLDDAGMRGRVRVLIGGAPVTQQFADQIRADACGANAAAAVDTARRPVGRPIA